MIRTIFSQVGGQIAPMCQSGSADFTKMTGAQLLYVFAISVTLLILVTWVHQWIWNNILVKYITIVNPVPTLWEFILLSLIFRALFGGQ